MFAKKNDGAIAGSLVLAVVLWGASNAGTKHVVANGWPPVWTGSTRLLCAGILLMAVLKWTKWLGEFVPLTRQESRNLWVQGSLSLAIYMIVFNEAMHLTAPSHVALYLGTAPIWALIWEERPALTRRSAQRYGAALLALAGIVVLFWPSLRSGTSSWVGEIFGMACSVTWAWYGRQCRALGTRLSGVEISAYTMWRGGLMLLPLALLETATVQRGDFVLAHRSFWRADLVLVQLYCVIGGGVLCYALWNNGLKHWPTSRVFLFNNLIPLSTTTWAWLLLGNSVTPTFWLAMLLIVVGVILGQTRWEKVLGTRWMPTE